MNAIVHGKCDRCHQFVADNGQLTVDQKVKVVFYAETKRVRDVFMHTLVQGGLLANRQFTDFH